MTTFADAVRAAIPGANDETINFVIWERTPFPLTRLTARDIFRAANRLRRAHDHGRVLCEFCDRLAERGLLCTRCDAILHPKREGTTG